MFERILGKKKSLQRNLIIEFSIVFIVLIFLSISVFYISVNKAIEKKLVDIDEVEQIDRLEIVNIVRRSVGITVITSALYIIIIMRYSARKILGPIRQINEATKKIATGDFDIELESDREDEIGQLTENFNTMAKDLNKIEVLQKDFINNMSHELKTPISSIKGFAQLLESENLTDEEKKEYIGIIVEESDRLLNISSNILKLSKLQNKEKLTNKKEVDISEQIRKVINILENKWTEKNIMISANLPKTIINGDEELLYQVWMNLIDNSIKFTGQDGKIDISIKKINNKAQISIKDNGIGMTEDEKKKIRFYTHIGCALLLALVMIAFSSFNNESVVYAIFKFAGYTYGPLLGLFFVGILLKTKVRDKAIPFIAASSIALTISIDHYSVVLLNGYQFGFEILLFNGALTVMGLLLFRENKN